MNNIEIFNETLQMLQTNTYTCTLDEMKEAIYLSKEKVNELLNIEKDVPYVIGRVHVRLVNQDSFQAAMDLEQPLILNFANAFRPGGGVTIGSSAQEEDLCRKSSLYVSITNPKVKSYYLTHKKNGTSRASESMILSKKVEIIRDERNNFLENTKVVSVLTCAAPDCRYETIENNELEKIMMHRINCILHVAVAYGYKNLVLGAWGCGAFCLDAKLVAKCFYNALKKFEIDNHKEKDFFNTIVFAVLDHSKVQYNYHAFKEYFEDYYKAENEEENKKVEARIIENEKNLDTIQGCMIGGAIGDALGYPIEFLKYAQIQKQYGTLDHYLMKNNKALISDDTQMSLFTANGILFGDTRIETRGIGSAPHEYVYRAYLDWLHTQLNVDCPNQSWLLQCNELYSTRAPGNTCLSALESQKMGTIEKPINHSKGCGGIMRIAPIACYYNHLDEKIVDMEAARIAAITHGHSLGYMSAAALCHILCRIIKDKNNKNFDLYKVMDYTTKYISHLFKGDSHLKELISIMKKAIVLSKNKKSDIENIQELGEGWVAEETLAIAMYCSLKYQNDFERAIVAAVNHSGDSDSTGAVTGNIMGALVGYSKIQKKWIDPLELKEVILEISKDLCDRCQISEYSSYRNRAWEQKYISGMYYQINQYLIHHN